MVGLVFADGCQVSALGAYFGEPIENGCGHCSFCLGDGLPAVRSTKAEIHIDPEVLRSAIALKGGSKATAKALSSPRAIARFLCGVSSPRASRARLRSNPLFGTLDHAPFRKVLASLEAISEEGVRNDLAETDIDV